MEATADKTTLTRSTVALCLDCNYELHSLPSTQCPECGRPFDLADLASFNSSRPLNWLDRRLLKPVGATTFLLASIPCAALLWMSLDPQIYYMWIHVFLTLILWAIVSAIVVARSLLTAFVPPRCIVRRSDARLRSVYLLVLFTSLSVFFCVPMRVAFLFARNDLDQLVRDIHDGKTPPAGVTRRVGPFVVNYSDSNAYGGDDTLFFHFVDSLGSGFAYCPTRGPRSYYNTGTDGWLGGPWHWWTDD